MDTFIQFAHILKHYVIEVLPLLALGFLLSGLIREFVPTSFAEKHLGGSGMKPLLYSVVAGTLLPICCIGALPVALSMHQKGAKLGPVLTFLVATPATSVTALLVTYTLLGLKFTAFIFFSVITMGLIIGLIGNRLRFTPKNTMDDCPSCAQETESDNYSSCDTEKADAIDPICGMPVKTTENALSTKYKGKTYYFCNPHCKKTFESAPEKYTQGKEVREKILAALKYGFWDMVKEIGPELIIGLVLAAVIATVTPIGKFVGSYLSDGWGYPFSLVVGMLMYICSTASVPLVDSLVNQGMGIGAGMVLLMVGPITSWSTIMVVRKEFGGKILLVYLFVVGGFSLAFGYLFSLI